MVLYSSLAWSPDGYDYTEPVLVGMIPGVIQEMNLAMTNSKIGLEINLVHVGQVSPRVEHVMPRGTWW